jgi:hypothetical protein
VHPSVYALAERNEAPAVPRVVSSPLDAARKTTGEQAARLTAEGLSKETTP